MLTADQILAAHKANFDILFGLTTKAFEGVEKLVDGLQGRHGRSV
jgi:hypothetical protein